jgi:hypothetical protein
MPDFSHPCYPCHPWLFSSPPRSKCCALRFKDLTTDYTDDTDQKMIHEELSREIIGAAMDWLGF